MFDDLDHWRRTRMPEDHKEWLWLQGEKARVIHVRCPSAPPVDWRLAAFLWGRETPFDDFQGDSIGTTLIATPASGVEERVEIATRGVDESEFWVRGTTPELSARAVWFLATTTKGLVQVGELPFSPPSCLEDRMGSFDPHASLQSAMYDGEGTPP